MECVGPNFDLILVQLQIRCVILSIALPLYGLSINKLKKLAYLRKKPRAFLMLFCSPLQPDLEGVSAELQSYLAFSHMEEGCGCLKSFLGKSY